MSSDPTRRDRVTATVFDRLLLFSLFDLNSFNQFIQCKRVARVSSNWYARYNTVTADRPPWSRPTLGNRTRYTRQLPIFREQYSEISVMLES